MVAISSPLLFDEDQSEICIRVSLAVFLLLLLLWLFLFAHHMYLSRFAFVCVWLSCDAKQHCIIHSLSDE